MRGNKNMRVRLKGIHHVRRTLANGQLRDHYYAWRGGPPINAQPGSPEFMRLYTEAHAALRRPQSSTLMSLIAMYKASAEFRQLAPSKR